MKAFLLCFVPFFIAVDAIGILQCLLPSFRTPVLRSSYSTEGG
jgi:hypothetical protein